MAKRLLLVCNDPAFFVAQHMHVAEAARHAGYEVHVATPAWDGQETIEAAGFDWHRLDMRRGPVNLFNVARVLGQFVALYKKVKPHLAMHITLKPILLGTIAARITGVDSVINYNTGLGYMFIDERPATKWLRRLFIYGYKLWMGHRNKVDVFLNPDDLHVFKRLELTTKDTSRVINGPGVDLDDFRYTPEPEGTPLVVLASRMLWHKGVGEFIEAARDLKARGIKARFVLVGEPDEGNLASVTREELKAVDKEGSVEWWGFRKDMPEVFRNATVAVLPSYREGLGKVLIEAAACGRALVATDVAGCREITRNGENGILVPARNARRLSEAIQCLLEQPGRRQQMGLAGRRIVEHEYSNERVAFDFLSLIDDMVLPKTVKRLHRVTQGTGREAPTSYAHNSSMRLDQDTLHLAPVM